jgi:hypothetical protein
LKTLFVCSKSTEKFGQTSIIGDYDTRVVTGAPTKKILREVGSREQVLAIGGGSVIDTAKILSKNPIVCYPTTGAGSSSTSWSVYWNGGIKFSMKRMLPREVLFNPEYIEDLPDSVIESTTYDIVSHCLDSLASYKKTNDSISFCQKALAILRKDGKNVIEAGNIAGKAIEITGTNLLHSLSYPLTGYYDISHGIALGYFLPKLHEFMGDYPIGDIIGDGDIDLSNYGMFLRKSDIDMNFVIDEAFKYDKIHEIDKYINEDIIRGLLNEKL